MKLPRIRFAPSKAWRPFMRGFGSALDFTGSSFRQSPTEQDEVMAKLDQPKLETVDLMRQLNERYPGAADQVFTVAEKRQEAEFAAERREMRLNWPFKVEWR